MKVIELTKGQVTLVDDDDYKWLCKYKWHLHPKCYAAHTRSRAYSKQRIILMHRMIMDAQDDEQVDHINHDTLDNRRENLRLCTCPENQRNRRKVLKSGVSSIFKGVSWNWWCHKWRARIKINNYTYYLGIFENEQDAALAYDMKAIELFGEFASLNFARSKT